MPVALQNPEVLAEVHELFRAYLKAHKQRQTPERFGILDEIYVSDKHLNADDIFTQLKIKGAHISRATVYNTLELLVACGLVAKREFGMGQSLYERAYQYKQHDHLICLDCNEVLEFCDPRVQNIRQMVSDIYQFEITQHALHLYGHCKKEQCEHRKN
jgi:Fur family transcriptional regulator, ferric uptake regulator